MGGWGILKIKFISAQLKLKLGLSLAKINLKNLHGLRLHLKFQCTLPKSIPKNHNFIPLINNRVDSFIRSIPSGSSSLRLPHGGEDFGNAW